MRKSTFAFALTLLVAIAWIGSQSNQPHAADAQRVAVQKWEYHFEQSVAKVNEDTFNKLGAEGWELCTLTAADQYFKVVFKHKNKFRLAH